MGRILAPLFLYSHYSKNASKKGGEGGREKKDGWKEEGKGLRNGQQKGGERETLRKIFHMLGKSPLIESGFFPVCLYCTVYYSHIFSFIHQILGWPKSLFGFPIK